MDSRSKISFILALSLIMALLAGCAGQQKAPTADSVDTEVDNQVEKPEVLLEEPEPPQKMTADDLKKSFQEVYTSCGSSRSQEDEQIVLEVAALEKVAADLPAVLPEDFETQYREWRSATIAAQIAADKTVLAEEYAEIIASRQLYAPAIGGLCEATPGLGYANYIDFDNDGISELLLVSAGLHNDYGLAMATVEIYGLADGHAAQLGMQENLLINGDIQLCRKDGKLYIGREYWGGGSALPHIYSYYELKDGTITFSNKIFGMREEHSDGTRSFKYFSLQQDVDDDTISPFEETPFEKMFPNQGITQEQYESLLSEYQEEVTIFSCTDDGKSIFFENSILSPSARASIMVNGEEVDLATELYGENGYVMAPIRPVLEKMGIAVCANSNLDTIIASTKKDTFELYDEGRQWEEKFGYYYMKFNDEERYVYTSSQKAMSFQMVDGQMIVPVDYVAGLFGAKCSWDTASRALYITSDIPAEDRMSASEAADMVNFTLEDAKRISEQYGYLFNYHPEHEWDAGQGYTNGKSYWWLCTLPTGISKDYADSLFFIEEIDLYEYVTIWNDGTMTFDQG